jgi:murein hydrolase activator
VRSEENAGRARPADRALPALRRSPLAPRLSLLAARSLLLAPCSLIVLAVLLLAGVAAPAGETGALARRILELQRRLRHLEEEARLGALEAEASRQWMDRLEVQIRAQDIEIEMAQQRLLLTEMELAQNNDALLEVLDTEARLLQDIETQKLYLRTRVAVVYRQGRHTALKLVLRASSTEEFLRHLRYFGILARLDRERLAALRRQVHELAEVRGRHKALGAELRELRRRSGEQRTALELRREEKQELLERLASQRKGFLQQNQQMLATARRLERYLERALERLDEQPAPPFERLRGRLRWPVEGRVLDRFGRKRHEKYEAVTVRNGISLGAEAGEAVRAVYRGRVRYAGRFHGYGRIVLLEHPGGYYTLYGHLGGAEVHEGQEVIEETILGTVGDTGMTAQPTLYFELRKGLEPQDPLRWLAPRSRKARSTP